jgi:hypothetical protein
LFPNSRIASESVFCPRQRIILWDSLSHGPLPDHTARICICITQSVCCGPHRACRARGMWEYVCQNQVKTPPMIEGCVHCGRYPLWVRRRISWTGNPGTAREHMCSFELKVGCVMATGSRSGLHCSKKKKAELPDHRCASSPYTRKKRRRQCWTKVGAYVEDQGLMTTGPCTHGSHVSESRWEIKNLLRLRNLLARAHGPWLMIGELHVDGKSRRTRVQRRISPPHITHHRRNCRPGGG